LKLTQAQLAERLNVAPATVSTWEIGDCGISIEAAIRLAELADISLDWLLRGVSESQPVGSAGFNQVGGVGG